MQSSHSRHDTATTHGCIHEHQQEEEEEEEEEEEAV
jgi:hypothetical protein